MIDEMKSQTALSSNLSQWQEESRNCSIDRFDVLGSYCSTVRSRVQELAYLLAQHSATAPQSSMTVRKGVSELEAAGLSSGKRSPN